MIILDTKGVDADQIFAGLWQGGMAPTGSILHDACFDCVVLCAGGTRNVYLPEESEFQLVTVLYCPYEDTQFVGNRGLEEKELDLVHKTAKEVARRIAEGETVLSSCYGGYNRSGLLSALALHYLTGVSGRLCAERVKRQRKNALHNPKFVELLNAIQATSDKRLEDVELDLWAKNLKKKMT